MVRFGARSTFRSICLLILSLRVNTTRVCACVLCVSSPHGAQVVSYPEHTIPTASFVHHVLSCVTARVRALLAVVSAVQLFTSRVPYPSRKLCAQISVLLITIPKAVYCTCSFLNTRHTLLTACGRAFLLSPRHPLQLHLDTR